MTEVITSQALFNVIQASINITLLWHINRISKSTDERLMLIAKHIDAMEER